MLSTQVGQTVSTDAFNCEPNGTVCIRGTVPVGMSVSNGVISYTPTQAESGSVEVVCFNGCAPSLDCATSTAAQTLEYSATALSECDPATLVEGWLTAGSLTGDHKVVNYPALAYDQSIVDPRTQPPNAEAFTTTATLVTRISDAAVFGNPSLPSIEPEYARRASMDASNTYGWLINQSGASGPNRFVVRRNAIGDWDFVRSSSITSSSRWHRTQPGIRVVETGGAIEFRDVVNGDALTGSISAASLGLQFINATFGQGEGNQSYDGTVHVVSGNSLSGQPVLVAFNPNSGAVYTTIPLNALPSSSVNFDVYGASASGQYIYAQTFAQWTQPGGGGGVRPQGLNVWDLNGNYLHTVEANTGYSTGISSHQDQGISQSSGLDVVVTRDFSQGGAVVGHRLNNTGTEVYWVSNNPDDCYHISAQNYQRPGYAVLGTSSCYIGSNQGDRPDWNHVVVIPLIDGANSAIPIAQSRHVDGNYNNNYYASNWAAPSPDLSAIIWGSPQAIGGPGEPIDALVAEPFCEVV